MRNLAVQSSIAVENIQNVTKKVTSSVENLVNHTKDLLQFQRTNVVSDYDKFVNLAIEYKQDAISLNQMMKTIEQASEETLNMVDEANHSLNELATTIENSTEGIENIAEQASHIVNVAQDVKKSGENTTEKLAELQHTIRNIRLE